MRILCGFCGKSVEVEEYDYAMWCNGELVLCGECEDGFNKGISRTRRI